MSTCRRARVLQHLEREGPGLVADLCAARGLAVEVLRLDHGVAAPRALDAGDLLVVMGGPMGVADAGDPRYPFLAPEIELLRQVLAQRQPVLGICLGAQLLAHAAGARIYPNQRRDAGGVLRPLREVGFGEVRLLPAEGEPALAGLTDALPVLHWHGDTFDLPSNAVRLAESDACANQAFRIGRRAFGLQFHVETDAALVRRWAREDRAFVESVLSPAALAALVASADQASAAMRAPAERLLGNILDQLLAS
jgi:GMP synthase (glutamine-hydrolysing)